MSNFRKIPVGAQAVCKRCGCIFTSLFAAGPHSNGEFCSRKCARGFSTAAKRTEINEAVSAANKKSQ
jgi:hypothetical protein